MISRRRVDSLSSSESRPPSSFTPAPTYSHVSVYRLLQMEVQIHSPSVKVVRRDNIDFQRPLPVFGDHDQITGKVILDPSCYHTGRLSVKIEGSFLFASSSATRSEPPLTPSGTRRKHVFYSSAVEIPVSPGSENMPPRSAFREAFVASVRRRPSASSLNSNYSTLGTDRSFPFAFDLPRSFRPGEEMPPSFSSLYVGKAGPHSQEDSGNFSVEYKVTVHWEAADSIENPSSLDVPILYQPDADFQSLDVMSYLPDSWLEMPLRSDRPIPFRCAITLPSPVTFSRAASIPYFVVFTTTPRSTSLAREIAADATISVSLLRMVTVNERPPLPPTPPYTPTSSSEESDSQRGKLLKRVAKNTPPLLTRSPRSAEDGQFSPSKEKPLPRLPTQTTFSESYTLQTSMCIGFPKRPRNPSDPQGHPSLETLRSLPDGLYKGKISLNKNMLPCIDWAGVSVKYYLDVSVLIGQDDLRARIPVRIL